MIRTSIGLALAAAALLSAPAFAQGVVTSSSNAVVSGTGVVVTPGAPSGTVVAPSGRILPGSGMVQASSTSSVVAGPSSPTEKVMTQTTTTRYWANVPVDFDRRADAQRWMALK
jgi:hypothetical protein